VPDKNVIFYIPVRIFSISIR